MSPRLRRRENISGYLFLLPSLVFFLGFVVYPMVSCIYLSFTDANMDANTPTKWIWFANYVELWQDEVFLKGLWNTIIIVLVSVPVVCIFSLWVASAYLLKNGKQRFASLLTALPAAFMSAVSLTYILMAGEGFSLSSGIAYPAGAAFAAVLFVVYIVTGAKTAKQNELTGERKQL